MSNLHVHVYIRSHSPFSCLLSLLLLLQNMWIGNCIHMCMFVCESWCPTLFTWHSYFLLYVIYIDTLLRFESNCRFMWFSSHGFTTIVTPFNSSFEKFTTSSVWFSYTFCVNKFDLLNMVKGKSSTLTLWCDAMRCDCISFSSSLSIFLSF